MLSVLRQLGFRPPTLGNRMQCICRKLLNVGFIFNCRGIRSGWRKACMLLRKDTKKVIEEAEKHLIGKKELPEAMIFADEENEIRTNYLASIMLWINLMECAYAGVCLSYYPATVNPKWHSSATWNVQWINWEET